MNREEGQESETTIKVVKGCLIGKPCGIIDFRCTKGGPTREHLFDEDISFG